MKLVKDHPRLDRGVLTYSELTNMRVRQATSFDAQVTDVGRGPERTTFARELGGRLVAPQDVPAGGVVSVQITCSRQLTCTPRSSPTRQAIVGAGRSGAWKWDVAATSPGDARILLTAIRYRGDTQVVRTETIVTAGVRVRSTPLYAVEAAVDARKQEVISVSAAVLAAAAALVAALALRQRRRRGRAGRTPARPRAYLPEAETETWPVISRAPGRGAWPGSMDVRAPGPSRVAA